jgi:hypothetical protein
MRTGGVVVLVLGALVVLVCRIAAGYTEAFNWDELSLFDRVQRSVAAGALVGGGRPGLAVLALWPRVAGCLDEVAVMHDARLLWQVLTAAYVLGIFALTREALRRAGSPRALHGAAVGTALLCLSPVFHRWSLQVRTDQLALAAASWGALFLLRSSPRPLLAALGGALIGVGFLASQKAAYLAALGVTLCVFDAASRRRETAARVGLAAGVAAVLVGLYYVGLGLAAGTPEAPAFGRDVARGMRALSAHSDVFGYATYTQILAGHLPHVTLVLLLAVASVPAVRRRAAVSRPVAHAWAVLALGLLVGIFHRSAFAYFWMTLGAFLAVGLALGYDAILDTFRQPRARRVVQASVWMMLVLLWLPAAADTLTDTQRDQRRSYAFIHQHFDASQQGFQLEGGLFCRMPAQPMPVLMYMDVLRHFRGPQAAENVRWMQQQFRERPIAFILGSHTLRLFPFPQALERFWQERYVSYYGPVMVPGRQLDGPAGTQLEFEALLPGSYRIVRAAGAPAPRLRLQGAELPTDRPFELSRGTHRIERVSAVAGTVLVWNLPVPVRPQPELPFYNDAQRRGIARLE